MEKTGIGGAAFWPALLTAIILFLLFLSIGSGAGSKKILLRTFREIPGLVKSRRFSGNWYRKTQRRLIKCGADFHYGVWVEPLRYLALRTLLAGVGLLVFFSLSAVGAAAASVIFFFLPDLLLGYLNRKDNESLLSELKLVYHALEIQIRAGIYLTDALTECYGSVRDRRLRKALLDLAGDIVMKSDIYEALEKFQRKFENRYIDSLCIIILQALESGQALELLGDIGEQIKDMEQTVLERKKGALDRSITFYQLGILAAVLGISLYACATHMMSAAAGF